MTQYCYRCNDLSMIKLGARYEPIQPCVRRNKIVYDLRANNELTELHICGEAPPRWEDERSEM
jgi:hypothetical protein